MGAAEALKSPARHPLFDRVLQPGAPETLRLSAAKGALPIPPHDLVPLQVRLLDDPAASVALAARDSLEKIPVESLAALVRDPACDAQLVDYAALSGRLAGEDMAQAIAHPVISDLALEALASTGAEETLGLLVTNEMRLIGHTRLLALLRGNPKLSGEQRRRLAELEREVINRQPRPKTPLAAVPEPAAEAPASASAPAPVETAEDLGLPPEAAAVLADGEAPPDGAADASQEYQDDYDNEEVLQRTDAFQKIQRLNVAERNILAMKGNSEERAILIRDTARVVSQAVLKNPRLSETEIVRYAGLRSVTEDILRTIASNREWTKTYAVALALVRNPKTPGGLSVQFLARLGTRDLKICAGDKNVPDLVRRQARNLFLVRTQPPKKTFKKAH
ncbi:MAG TPA: hypothetical protein VGS03_01655 [Candidatus Polarisedimenticolia bacterium]|jgi:hypothetical protein|nr:hypothetical protein [Candidatus Polarisedimenticolia bacterium]